MVLGYFGKTPVPPDPEIVRIAAEKMELEPTTENPVDINDRDPSKGVAAAKKLLKDNDIEKTDENIFIAATCKQKGIDFLLGKAEINGVRKKGLTKEEEKPAAPGGDGCYMVKVGGREYAVEMKGDKASVNGQIYDISICDCDKSSAAGQVAHESVDSIEVSAPMNAKIIRSTFRWGTT